MRIAIIGGGVMGELIARSLFERNIAAKEQVIIAEILEQRRQELKNRHNFQVVANQAEAVRNADLVILCVKPQSAKETMSALKGKIPTRALVISIMAGATLKTIQEGLSHRNVVRSMPNIASSIGMGMTVWMADESVPDLELLLAKVVFQSIGKELRVFDDDMVDAATAVSGTGPAYIFYVAEKLIESSQALGFDYEQSKWLVNQTFLGAMEMWKKTKEEPMKLRLMVTSEKGTTHAAVKKFEELKTGEIFRQAVNAAFKRAKELGGEVSH